MVAEYDQEISPIWKLKVPLKIRVTLTKDNLLKRNRKGDRRCCFCSSAETIQHLFFNCHVAKFACYALFFTFGIQTYSWLAGFTNS